MARYYPGFLGAFFIVLLRVAIGWHFLTEGLEKHQSTRSGKEPFSAEIYLRNATGPLAPYFRGMVPDVNGLAVLDETRLKATWRLEVERVADHFGFDQPQRSQAQKILDESERWANYWFSAPENNEKRQKYYHDLGQVQKTERNPDALSFELERAWDARRSLDSDRRALTRPLIAKGKELRESIAKLATSEQLKAAAPLPERLGITALLERLGVSDSPESSSADPIKAAEAARAWSELDVLNLLTIYGLIAIGVCLILGFLTPLAALGAAAFLAMIYLSMPPWPGLPPNPRTEGHYFIVSKNLVELIACMVVATTPNGHWIGLDALFFGARRRRRLAPPPEPDRGRDRSQDQVRPVTKRDEHDEERRPIPIG